LGFQFGQTSGQASASTAAISELRQGMSLTVNLIEQQATNVLEVPSQAITTQGGSSYVELKNSSGAMVQTLVTTGLTNFVDTQITSGLVAGDVVVIATTKSSSAAATTTTRSVGLGISGGIGGSGSVIGGGGIR